MLEGFSQGDIIWFNFPKEPKKPQYTIIGYHPALILHDDSQPNKTVILSPLTKLHDKNGEEKELKSYHLVLRKKDYPQLDYDSYVKLDQIMTFSRHRVRDNSFICSLTDKDKAAAHLKLIEALQMEDTIKEIVEKQLETTVKKVLNEYIKELAKGS